MVGKQRNFGLDVVRGISILLVLRAHRYSHQYEWGLLGVQVFFVLSGFLIGQILIRDFSGEGDFTTVFRFWKRRWYRTLPLYYLILILKILFFGNPYGWKMLVYFFFLQANFIGIDFFPVSWSLVVEEWFYIFLPIVTLVFCSKGISGKRFGGVLVFWTIFFLLARFFWNYFEKGLILYQFDCLLLGVLLALCKVKFNNLYQYLNSPILLIVSVVGLFIMITILGDISDVPLFSPFYRVFWYFITSLLILIAIPYVEQSTFINQKLAKIKSLNLFFTWTSILTYAMYLIHTEVYMIHLPIPEFLNLVIHGIVLYGLSLLIYIFYEHPMMSLRDNLSLSHYLKTVKSFSLGKKAYQK